MEVAMFDNISLNAFSGNKSLKSRLEAVRLQITALRAVEQQILQWMLDEQAELDRQAQAEIIQLTKDQVKKITDEMTEGGFTRASSQSAFWAGVAVIKVMCDPSGPAVNEKEYARRAIDFMLKIKAISKINVLDAAKGREFPAYQVCQPVA
jgi:dissimilatory sulfite reductase (desulfoviridin) alpha/beta subunit